MAADAARVLELALAAAPVPLSIDTLVSWNVARPGELWAFLSRAREEGRVCEPEPGRFALGNGAARDEAFRAAEAAAWDALLSSSDRVAWIAEAGRAALADRRFPEAKAIHLALVAARRRDLFPGGEAGWLATVLEVIRLFRAMEGIATSDLETALDVAAALGDVGAQGVLHGALGAAALRDGHPEQAERHLSHARDAADAVTGKLRFEIHMYLSAGLIFQGRLREGIESFEELLGDVPDDVGAFIEPASPTPARALLVLASAYCAAGQVPRVLDLMHRLRVFGRERGIPILEHEADLYAAIAHDTREEWDAARPHAERAWAFYGGTPQVEPILVWYAATVMGCALAAEGRWDEVASVLERGLEHRRASRWPAFGNPAALRLVEQLELAGSAVEGLDLLGELDRMEQLPSLFWKGIALRYRARHLARAPRDEGDLRAAAELLDRSLGLLREAGAGYELSRALADAAGLARGAGRAEDAARLGAELREAEARSPAPRADGRRPAARLSGLLLELGRLGSLAPRREGTWGEIAARLCRSLGAERCALVERGAPPRLLGLRGGGASWREAILALLAARAPATVETLPAPELAGDLAAGQLLVVPFAAEGRAGWACLENRHGAPAVGPGDAELLEVVSVQLGILLGNVALWQELASARERLEAENRYWRSTRPATAPGSRIVGDSPALRAVLELVARVAPTHASVLVSGETGVGKELVASEIHRQSPRRDGPFIAVHVASLSPGLVASGLFGHERGAFTGATEQTKGRFELAHGGTLFLDEVGELSPEDQVRLLRVLQEGVFERVGGTRAIRSDFRLVAATNRDLASEVRAGRFREDLYYRLAAFPLVVPPLRERREEIPTLALFFMERASRPRGVRFEGIGEADMRRMMAYPWPGNVRELEHVVERAVLLSEPPRLRIPPLEASTRATPCAPSAAAAERREWVTLAEAERRYLLEVLRHVRGRITGAGGAAEILGMKPSTLNFRIAKLGLKDAVRRARLARASGGDP